MTFLPRIFQSRENRISAQLVLEVTVDNLHSLHIFRQYYAGLYPNDTLFMALLSNEEDEDEDSFLLIRTMNEFFRSFETNNSGYLDKPERGKLPAYMFYHVEYMAPWVSKEIEQHMEEELSHYLPNDFTKTELMCVERWRQYFTQVKYFQKN